MPKGPVHFIPIWKTAPFLRLVLPLICGIIFSYYFPFRLLFWQIATGVLAILFSVAFFNARRYPLPFGILSFICWVVIGATLHSGSRIENRPDFIGNIYRDGVLISAVLATIPEEKANSFRAEAKVRQWDTVAGKWISLQGKVILYFEKDSLVAIPAAGQIIAFAKTLQPIRNSGNPGAFNYREYAAANGWFYQVYLKKDDYILSAERENIAWRMWPLQARAFLLNTLRKYMPDIRTLGVAEALLTGYRNDMDKELAWQYAGTGVAHIIAISGLHLGMIQVALLGLLSPLKRLRNGVKIVPLVVIICLWVFALVTGAGPSVLRSALMFSILLFGKVIGREGNSYNSLAASAFILLLYNPELLFNVGFQLSYSAVLSIFMFSRPIGNWVPNKVKWIKKGWQMLAVTLAAQILTLPFVVYYFHQFPTYFLLANLIAVPLTWLVLNLSLLLTLVFWWFDPVAKVLGLAIDLTIRTMNEFIAWIHQLPMARIENIYLTLPQAIWLMGIIALMAAWLLLRSKNSAVLAFSGILALVLFREVVWTNQHKQQKLIVYNISKHSAIDFIKGHQTTFWGDTACLQDPLLFRMHLQPSRTLYQVSQKAVIEIDTAYFQVLTVAGKKILLLDKDIDTRRSDTITVDILLLAENIKAKPEWILEKIRCSAIVADAKMPFYRVAQWQSAADSLHLRFHAVAEKGAFVLNLAKE